jgi:hypothetical protein
MIISKGGIEKEYHFYVRDGEPGKTPKISVGEVNHLPYSSDLVIYKTGTDENVILNFGIP